MWGPVDVGAPAYSDAAGPGRQKAKAQLRWRAVWALVQLHPEPTRARANFSKAAMAKLTLDR